MLKYDVAVVFGGVSNENEISVITGTMVCNVLKKGGKKTLPLYLSQSGKLYAGEELADIELFKGDNYVFSSAAAVSGGEVLFFSRRGKVKKRAEIACAVNCCHGGLGEGGGVCGLFGLNGIPLASAGLFESAAFMDKYYTKLVLNSLKIPVAPYVYVRDATEGDRAAAVLGYPVIVKPCKLGSSIGVTKADNGEELSAALGAAFELDDAAIVEKFFAERREINCAAYMAKDEAVVSECEEAIPRGELLSYDDKYAGGGKSVFPAQISGEQSQCIREYTRKVYCALNMRGIVRFDYIIAEDMVYLSEINTVPGSLSYYLLSAGFEDFCRVLEAVIEQAEADRRRKEAKLLLNTGIINNLPSNACKIK